ncbi:hydrogenase nickel incorporation protein HypB [Acidithiobacillus sp. 'AMD consortium']|uniref:Hydrogenase maturation factor HypB n=2 Tax=Acidithiobacillus ferridurans TaxID=1232575 RepID=A0A8X8KBR1_ACIFI|nr:MULTISPECIES: hydrogenase nickel incorporation protein HypB [Acidithiobacillus]MBU2716833.1 hydrogenase nickel incorporation protein HypB [Acidithiobacillus ferridurans]MBU2724117.1 hydrogenase nickel incorporation protein HypB [Acidithiobacillus ferridurans]MBU2726729.1 hydrogenase nickel incorporation protein HypB [Acidithiobacillus ferridurans]QFG77964.1 hydrogenase nickel incorporation protein HypB [Acidithiobacillus sp. 'AMD consortium']BBF65734.1 Hydrogenase isoenzymes nickel incorpor
MCKTCGCSDGAQTRITHLGIARGDAPDTLESSGDVPGHAHEHRHGDAAVHNHGLHSHAHGGASSHLHPHPHVPADGNAHLVSLEARILDKNDRLAERNRGWLAGRGVFSLNLMSSPGAGKTTLLEKTLAELAGEFPLAVVEGDQETTHDAERIRQAGCNVVQINTGQGCHLEADMVAQGLQEIDPAAGSVVFIENVGNLVCPALFDLGEAARVVILAVTEGEDKPAKYPHMFHGADLILINKIDLLPYLSFDLERCLGYLHEVAHHAEVLQISAATGAGLEPWFAWLREHRNKALSEAGKVLAGS